MVDGGVKIGVGLDISKAERQLSKLKDKINKAEDQLNKSTGKRDAISERLDAATQKAETARQKIAELNEELAKGKGGGQIDTRKIDEALAAREKLAEKLTQIDMKDYYAKLGDLNIAKGEQFDLQNKIGKLEHLSNQGAITPENYAAELAKLQGPLDTVNEKVRKLSDELKQIGDASGYNGVKQEMKDLDLYITQMQHKATPTPLDPNEVKKATEEIAEQEKVIKDAEKEAEKLKTEFEKIDEKVKDGEKSLEDMKKQAGKMVESIERARPGESLAKGFDMAKKSAMKFLKYAIGIRSVFFLWRRLRQYISDAVQLYAEYDKETKYNLALMQATKKAVQGTFGSAFAQIYTSLLPVIQKITNWMLEAANAAARFIAILSGKGSYKKAVVDVAEVEKSIADAAEDANDEIEDTTAAAKELQRTLAPIDELNIIGGDNDSGTGSSAKDKTKAEKAAKTATDGIKYVEESLETLNDSFLDKFALNFKDVLFNWDDLNPEQIAKKFIAGLGALLGAALGIALGLGPGGVLMLTLGGLILGLIADQLIFNNDGKLDREEIASMILMLIGAITGGILGGKVGGVKGALIGIWIGAALGLTVSQLLFDRDGTLTPEEIAKAIMVVAMGLIGGASFFMISGNPKVGIVGTILGAGLGFLISKMFFDNDGKLSATELRTLLYPVLNAIVGGIAGFVLTKSPVGAGFMALIGLTVTLFIQALKMDMSDKAKATTENILGLLSMVAGGIIGFKLGGPFGGVIGLIASSIVVAITSIALDHAQTTKEQFRSSEFGQEVAALKEDIEKALEVDADIKVHIDSITGEVDESTIADLAVAQNLIDSIFTLDAKSNKTTEEAALLQQQIETLNSMNLEGIRLEFDETTGHVQGTRGEIQGLLDDLLQQYKLEAMKEAYIESFKAQYDATENVKKATDNAKDASEKYETAVKDLSTAQSEYNQALQDYQQYTQEIQSSGSGGAISDEAQAAANRLAEASKALDLAKQGVEATKDAAEKAKSTLETAMDTADLATEKVGDIEDALTDLVTTAEEKGEQAADGLGEGMSKHSQKAVDAAKTMAQKTLDEISNVLDAHSPSKETEKQGEWAAEGLAEGIKAGTPRAVSAVKEMMDQIYRELHTNLERIKGLMKFSWSLPRPKIPRIGWNIKKVSYGKGQSVSIPEFFVNWYAKGGVFDFPSLIGVGEKGKEAVVPLEKNTEWMNLVADGLMDRLEQANFANQLADAFMRTPMPAMAGGGIVPPGAIQGGGGFSTSGIEDAIERGIYNAMMAMGNNRRSGGFEIKINGREFMRAVYDDFKAVENEHGISMIET